MSSVHTLGNVVVASALKEGLRIDNYAMLNAAIPAQCFDPNPQLNENEFTEITWDSQTLYGEVTTVGYSGADLGDDPLISLRALAYRNRVGATKIFEANITNFYLRDDYSLLSWEANQWGALDNFPFIVDTKMIDGYSYNVGVDLKYNYWGPGSRAVSGSHEAMSMANQSMTKPAGNKVGVRGAVSSEVDLDSGDIQFGKEHEAAFKLIPSSTWTFYRVLLEKLRYPVSP